MKISIVIPTYNRQSFLSQTLHYLSKQKITNSCEMEIIVVDDGSTDSTCEVVEMFQKSIKIEYLFHLKENSEISCVSLIRNLGIQKSTGDIVTFLDCGVLVPSNFVERTAEKYSSVSNCVLIHYIVGKRINPEVDDLSVIDAISPDTLLDKLENLMLKPSWADPRDGYFNLGGDDINSLPAPWTLGWTCALTVPKNMVQKIGGFDESYKGWGVEDDDFSYRLYKAGASFNVMMDCPALHLPHPTASREEKMLSNRENSKKFHRKNYQFETEMFYLYEGHYCNQVMGRFEHLIISHLIPKYPLPLLEQINSEILASANNSLLMGIDDSTVARYLNTTHLFVYNKTVLARFTDLFTDRDISHTFGTDTPFDQNYFDVVIISDYVRSLGTLVRQKLILEMMRISRIAIIIYTEGFIPPAKQIDGWPWVEMHELVDSIKKMGFDVTVKNIHKPHCIIMISQEKSS